MVSEDQPRHRTHGNSNSRVTNFQSQVRTSLMFRLSLALLSLALFSPRAWADSTSRVIISVREQKLMLVENGSKLATYPVSTSKFGLGDHWGRMTTPLGVLQVARKIGDHAPVGAVFRNRRFTGDVIKPNAPGRDPVITRIMWLRGLEASNAHAFSRCIYIHGTPEEKLIGRPASYGCIRMKSRDVAALYARVPLGAIVEIVPDRLPKVSKASGNPTSTIEKAKPEPEKISVSKPREKSSGRIAPPPAQRKLDQDEIAVLLKRGKDLIANGDLAAARLVLQRAANANDAEAALALGATYDPYVLRALKVYGFKADPDMARVWYEKARELGSAAAPRRLEMLTSGMR
jgi:lipoprotein-anchoring transpeptidase ErfK/SrfK